VRNKLVVALLGLAAVVAWQATSCEEAPIQPGTFLVYDIGGILMRLTFSPADDDRFGTTLDVADDDRPFGSDEFSTS